MRKYFLKIIILVSMLSILTFGFITTVEGVEYKSFCDRFGKCIEDLKGGIRECDSDADCNFCKVSRLIGLPIDFAKCEPGSGITGEERCKSPKDCNSCDYRSGRCVVGGGGISCGSKADCTTCDDKGKCVAGGGGPLCYGKDSNCATCDDKGKCVTGGGGRYCYGKDEKCGFRFEEREAEETAAISEYSLLVDTLASNKGLNSLGSLLIALIPIIIFRKRWFG